MFCWEAVRDIAVGDRDLALGGACDDVEDVEQLACVASRETEQRARLPDLDFPLPEFRVGGQRPVEQRLQVASSSIGRRM